MDFLGFTLLLDTASWGSMLSYEGRHCMELKPELALLPDLCLTVVIFGINMFVDAMRELLDLRLSRGER